MQILRFFRLSLLGLTLASLLDDKILAESEAKLKEVIHDGEDLIDKVRTSLFADSEYLEGLDRSVQLLEDRLDDEKKRLTAIQAQSVKAEAIELLKYIQENMELAMVVTKAQGILSRAQILARYYKTQFLEWEKNDEIILKKLLLMPYKAIQDSGFEYLDYFPNLDALKNDYAKTAHLSVLEAETHNEKMIEIRVKFWDAKTAMESHIEAKYLDDTKRKEGYDEIDTIIRPAEHILTEMLWWVNQGRFRMPRVKLEDGSTVTEEYLVDLKGLISKKVGKSVRK